MEVIGTAAASRLLRVTPKTVARYCETGLLKAKREKRGWLGRYRWIIKRETIEEFIKIRSNKS